MTMMTSPAKTTLRLRPAAALTCAGITLAMLAGCSPQPEPTPTETPLFASEEEAFAAAEETYRAYMTAYNAIDIQDPTTFEATREFVGGDFATEERKTLSRFHAEGYTRTGSTHILDFSGETYTEAEAVVARTCNDVSETDFVSTDGNSIVSSERQDVYALDLTFTVQASTLRLTDAVAVEDPTCAP
ncbi:hypothetical protein ACLD0U_03095 [Microbacterium sp. 2216-1]|uniref:hypothetical protein n=1 Tax=Microbacterium sp. 2216-1 TaxID=3390053 RepID=UPI0039771912